MKNWTFIFFTLFLFQNDLYAHLPPGFAQYEVAGGLNPTDMDIAPDGRVFITEKNGHVRIVENDILLPDPFLVLPVNDFNERGLGHIALDPDFSNNGFVYLFYTVTEGTHNRLSRFTAVDNFALTGSELILYECDHVNGSVHNGGDIGFDLSGKIIFSTGENGFANAAQSLESDLGKVLRINRDGTIPDDNPFYSSANGKYKAIYALGLRNPFGLSINRLTGAIYVTDVGGQNWEELNEILPGKNYGYPLIEGKAGSQSTPADYMDPIYAYDHNTGCAILGAAFYNPATPSFPANYNGKFFFADYCKGYIQMFNPVTKMPGNIFIPEIARPVSICTSLSGDFYYLARAGIGGGSEQDNTASNNGSLWRVIYTGSDAPFVYGHPTGGLFSVGDSTTLKVFATGVEPMAFRWQKNDVDVAGGNQSTLQLPALSLADSGALYRCIIQNEYGFDTSKYAVIRVTSNKRPVPVITLPTAGTIYKAGTNIVFSGFATDAENGNLNDSMLTWKIYFYHDEHFHPALSPVSGIAGGVYPISSRGEPDDNVWYRIILSAVDSTGLETTVFRDILPLKNTISVNTVPEGVMADIDGIGGPTPLEINAVAGMERQLKVPDFLLRNDSVLLFDTWESGGETAVLNFTVPDSTPLDFNGFYEIYPVGNGMGLLGEYLHQDLNPPAYMVRIDSVVNYSWGEGSPAASNIPFDNFTVRWSGTVQPYFTDTLTFFTVTDDGVRLWVDDSLLIDKWQGQPTTEYSGQIALQGGKRYSVVMEFLENSGAAKAELWWASNRVPKSIIPQSQLYPPKPFIPNQLDGLVWIDPDGNGVKNEGEITLTNAIVMLNDTSGHSFVTLSNTDGKYAFAALPSNTYTAYVLPPLGFGALLPGFGMLPSGYSLPITFKGEEKQNYNFGFLKADEGENPEGDSKLKWNLYPNPGRDQITFSKNYELFTHDLTIRVFDQTGKLLIEQESPAGQQANILKLGHYPRGTYVVAANGQARYLLLY